MDTAKKGLNMMYLNIRSLYKHKYELFLNFSGYDILAIGETWLNACIPSQCIQHPDYTVFRIDRASNPILNKRGGGLLSYVHNTMGRYARQHDVYTSITGDIEQLWVDINVPHHKKLMIINVYRPPVGNIGNAILQLRNNLGSWEARDKYDIVIMGDLNINMKHKKSPGYDLLTDFCKDYFLSQVIKHQTHITQKTSSLIDLVITNIEHISNVCVHNIVISDHLPVSITKKKDREIKEYSKVTCRSMSKYDKTYFQSLINNDRYWCNFWQLEGVEEKWHIMHKIILHALNEALPLKSVKVRKNNPNWITPEIIALIKLKNSQFKLAKSSADNELWIIYRKTKHTVNRMIKRAKKAIIKTTLDTNKNDPKQFWLEIQSLMGTNKMNSDAIKTIQNTDGVILNDKKAADFINGYYANIGSDLAKCIPSAEWKPHLNFTQFPKGGFSFRIITERETSNMVKQIDVSKASAMEGIKSVFVKDAFECINFELCYLLNESLRVGEFPPSWGYSYVTPIPKDGDRLNVSNWRPISQMPIIGRLIKKAIHTQLKYYLACKGLLHRNQHGFRAGKSTGSAIFEYMNSLYTSYDRYESSVAVYIDYKKAFDTIAHDILIKKMELYGFGNVCLKWLGQYLGSRKQCTIVNGFVSDSLPISFGVPQGSTLGPTLFIIYVNDLLAHPNMKDVSTVMYADDTVIYTSHTDPAVAVSQLQGAMDAVVGWCNINKLTINENKTKYTMFLRKPSNVKYKITCNSIALEHVNSYKYLGADIDHTLTMDLFISNVCKKVNFKIYMFKKIRKYVTKYSAIMIYKQTILPYFDYGSFLMGSANQSSIANLDKYQKRAIRLIEYKPKQLRSNNINILLSEYRIINIRLRRDEQLLAFMYMLSLNIEFINNRRPIMTLRSSKKIKFKETVTSKTITQKSPYFRGVALWNALPVKTLSKFKNLIKLNRR